MPIMPRNVESPPPHPRKQADVKNNPTTTDSNSLTRTASGLAPEAEDQFELELCWCIQQLEAGLSDKKLQDKQIYNMTKSLAVLKSGNASLIKKRQVMRNTFGDYRSKMASDEKKFAKTVTAVKFAPTSKKLEKKSVFLKKATSAKCIDEQLDKKLTIDTDASSEPFKFNFTVDES